VVDNETTTAEAQFAESEDAAYATAALSFCVTTLPQTENLGYAAGMNVGIDYALSRGATHVLALNNDAIILPDTLEVMMRVAQTQSAALVGACIVSPEKLGDPPTFTWLSARWPHYVFKANVQVTPSETFHEGCPTHIISGTAMLLRRDLLTARQTAVGEVFDPQFFMYQEDVDVCLFAKKHGFKCVLAMQARVQHTAAANFGGAFNPQTQYYTSRNRIYIANRWLPLGLKIIFHLYYLPAQLVLRAINRGKWSWASRLATLRGVIDGYRGVKGKVALFNVAIK
jgi:hypothetical protein